MAALRSLVRAGVLAFLLGSAASWSLIAERITRGASTAAYPASIILVLVAVLVSVEARLFGNPRERGTLLLTQVVGASAAVVVAHTVLALVRPAGLVEQPPQFVNDVVLIASLSAFAWTNATRSTLARLTLVAPAAALLVAYATTSSRWHCDSASFVQPIQQLVVFQVLLAALFLLLLDILPRRS